MSAHALLSPSAAHRWMECPGSMAWPENTQDGESSTFADDGTASHEWASRCLNDLTDAEYFLGDKIELNGNLYTMDEARVELVQTYLDLVRERAIGRELFIEHRIDLSEWLGPDQGGTLDAGVIGDDYIDVIDLKGGSGHKVYASYVAGSKRLPNHQLGLYAAGLLRDAALLGKRIARVNLIIVQPKLYHIDIQDFSVAEILELVDRARKAATLVHRARALDPCSAEAQGLMSPSEATCLWCRPKAQCQKLAQFVKDETASDFETIEVDPPQPTDLSMNYAAVPLILQWCYAVQTAVHNAVAEGGEVLGSDGLPLKFVEGKMGSRKWIDEEAAAAALVGQIGPKAYQPQRIITAPVAAKLLDKKATKQLWTDLFEPLIHKPPGKAQLALGSDERPAYVGTTVDDFEEIGNEA